MANALTLISFFALSVSIEDRITSRDKGRFFPGRSHTDPSFSVLFPRRPRSLLSTSTFPRYHCEAKIPNIPSSLRPFFPSPSKNTISSKERILTLENKEQKMFSSGNNPSKITDRTRKLTMGEVRPPKREKKNFFPRLRLPTCISQT